MTKSVSKMEKRTATAPLLPATPPRPTKAVSERTCDTASASSLLTKTERQRSQDAISATLTYSDFGKCALTTACQCSFPDRLFADERVGSPTRRSVLDMSIVDATDASTSVGADSPPPSRALSAAAAPADVALDGPVPAETE